MEGFARAPYAREWHEVAALEVADVMHLQRWRNITSALEIMRHNLAEAAVAAAATRHRAKGLGFEQALSAVLAESRQGLEPGSMMFASSASSPEPVGLEFLQVAHGQVEDNLAELQRRSADAYSMLPRALRCRGNPARPLASHLALATARHAAAQGPGPVRLEA